MGLLDKLLSHGDTKAPTVKANVTSEQRVNVVGESNYQPAIRAACGWKPGQDTRFECFAELVPEPTNPHDPNAVMVRIDGQRVGYLSRQDAKELGPVIVAGIKTHGSGMCRAFIAGRADGDTTNLGVFLSLNLTH